MKRIFIALGLLFWTGYAFGQARDGTIEYHRSLQHAPAAVIDLPYAPDVVRVALERYLSETGKSTKNGLSNYQLSDNTLLVRHNLHNAELRLGIGAKSQGNKNESVVYLMLESTVENRNLLGTVNRTPYRFDLEEAKAYLNNLAAAVGPYAADLQLKLQTRDLAKAEAKNRTLLGEAASLAKRNDALRYRANTNESGGKANGLERRKAQIEQKIRTNKAEQAMQATEVEAQKLSLSLLSDKAK